jgi:hypothetical protein
MEAVMGKSVLENVNKTLKDIANKKPKDQVKALEDAAKDISKASKDATLDQAYQSFIKAYQISGLPKLDKKHDAVVAEVKKRLHDTAVSKTNSDSSLSTSSEKTPSGNSSPSRSDSGKEQLNSYSQSSTPEKELPGAFAAKVAAEKKTQPAQATAKPTQAELLARLAATNASFKKHELAAQTARNEAEAARRDVEAADIRIKKNLELLDKILDPKLAEISANQRQREQRFEQIVAGNTRGK